MNRNVQSNQLVFAKKSDYDPLDSDYISMKQRKLNIRVESFAYSDNAFIRSDIKYLRDVNSLSDVNITERLNPTIKRNSMKRNMKVRKHPATRNIDALKADTRNIFIKGECYIPNLKISCGNVESKLKNYGKYIISSNTRHNKSSVEKHFKKVIISRLDSLSIEGMNPAQFFPNIENKKNLIIHDNQELQHKEIPKLDESSLKKWVTNAKRHKSIMLTIARSRSELKNKKNYLRINKLKVDQLYKAMQKNLRSETTIVN